MKHLFLGLTVTLVLTAFMFAFMTSAVFAELRQWAVRGLSARRN